MGKYEFPNGAPNVLSIKLTYEQFLNLMTDAWLEAGKHEAEPDYMFRRAFFYNLDKLMAAQENIGSQDD